LNTGAKAILEKTSATHRLPQTANGHALEGSIFVVACVQWLRDELVSQR
jgi:glycerol kinase